MHKRKTFLLLAVAVILTTACSLTNQATRGAALSAQNAPGTPTAADRPETIATPTQGGQRCTVDTGTPGGALNLRACAGTGCAVLDTLTEGDTLTVISTADGWQRVQTQSGTAGFVNSKYCKKTE